MLQIRFHLKGSFYFWVIVVCIHKVLTTDALKSCATFSNQKGDLFLRFCVLLVFFFFFLIKILLNFFPRDITFPET